MKWRGNAPTIPRQAYAEAKAVPIVHKRRPKGSVLAIAMRHRVDPEHLRRALSRGIKRYEAPP